MSEDTKENKQPQISNDEWLVKTTEWKGLDWKAENSSEFLWNSEKANLGMGMSKAHTSGTPSDEQVGIGDTPIDREPKKLEMDSEFDSPREMGSVTENPSVKAQMMSPEGEGSKKFEIEATNKPPISRPTNDVKQSPVALLSKAIEILSAAPDEVDIADSIDVFLKGDLADSIEEDEDLDDEENTNWEPLQRPSSESIASGTEEEEEEGDDDLSDVEHAIADTTDSVGKKASKAAKTASKKVIDAAKTASDAAVAQLDTPIDKQGEDPEALTIKAVTLMKALNEFEDFVAVESGDFNGIMKALSNALEDLEK